jgi:hypothetical protein
MCCLRPGLALPVLALLAATPLAGVERQTAQTARRPAAVATKLPPAREIIDRHIKAIGGREAVLAHTSAYAKGTVTIASAGLTGSVELFAAKPNKTLTRSVLPGIGEILEGFDGTVGWAISPLTGPSVLRGKQLEQKKFDADFYNELKPESSYTSITTVEKTTFEGRPCFKVRFVRPNGDEQFEFFDVETGLKAGFVGTRETEMGTVAVTEIKSDYKKFGNLLESTSAKQSLMGLQTLITIATIEYDKVDPSVFELPVSIKAMVK